VSEFESGASHKLSRQFLCFLPEYIYVDASIVPSNTPRTVAQAATNLVDPNKNCNLPIATILARILNNFMELCSTFM
jgi:hypothetical protein